MSNNILQFYNKTLNRTRRERTLLPVHKVKKSQSKNSNSVLLINPTHFHLTKLCIAERSLGSIKTVEGLGKAATTVCHGLPGWCSVCWHTRLQQLLWHLCSQSIPWYSPSLWYSRACDLTQLYKPRAIHHLGWGKWFTTGSRKRAQSSGWDQTHWLLHRQISGFIHLPPWQAEVVEVDGIHPTLGLTTLVLSAENKIRF